MRQSMTYGILPSAAEIAEACEAQNLKPNEVYHISTRDPDEYAIIANAINRGIDAHLEAVFAVAKQENGRAYIEIEARSLYAFLRRLIDLGNADDAPVSHDSEIPIALDLASSILETLGFEWI